MRRRFRLPNVDTAIDAALEKISDRQAAEKRRGKAAIANACLAYGRYQELFAGPRWESLAAAGAKTQRLLWASTGTKNPAYNDTLYIETQVGRDPVNTMPPATLDAIRDHGIITPDAIEQDATAPAIFLPRSKSTALDKLVVEGVKLFSDAFARRHRGAALQADRIAVRFA